MTKHDDTTRYLICVLFAHGLGEQRVAKMLRHHRIAILSKGQVSGVINRAGDGELRNLDKAARQQWLDFAKQFRQQNDPSRRLTDEHFVARDRH